MSETHESKKSVRGVISKIWFETVFVCHDRTARQQGDMQPHDNLDSAVLHPGDLAAGFGHVDGSALFKGASTITASSTWVNNIVLIELTTIGMLLFLLVHYDRKSQYTMARYACRILDRAFGSVFPVLLRPQFTGSSSSCSTSFSLALWHTQVVNDPNLSRDVPLINLFSRKAREDDSLQASSRRKYIWLNFFNLFWVFMIASVWGRARGYLVWWSSPGLPRPRGFDVSTCN